MIPIPKQKLDKLLTKMRHYDIHPIDLPDIGCFYGESHPLSIQIDELVSELCEYLLAANVDELNATYNFLDSFWREQIAIDLLLKQDPQTVRLAAIFLIIMVTKRSHNDIKRYIKSDYRTQSDVLKIYPELANYEDEEGLIPFGTPHFVPTSTGGGIYYKDHLLFYHQFLRRNFTSNFNSPFLNTLAVYHKEHQNQRVAIAIDHLRCRR
jgi:hypothetical protein